MVFFCCNEKINKIGVKFDHMYLYFPLLEALLLISVHFDVTGTRNLFQRYKNVWKWEILIQNFERSRMYSLYSEHVMSYHRCMFAENYHFNIFRIKWDRNIKITVICDHFSHAQGRWPVYLLFKNLKCRSNGHVTAATAHHHVSRAAPPVLEIYLSYYHFLTHAIMPVLSMAWKTNQTVALCQSFNSTCSSSVFYIKLIPNSRTLVESFVAF